MSTKKKDRALIQEQVGRLQQLMGLLRYSQADLCKALGYSNNATISRIMRDYCSFFDSERLYKLSKIKTADGESPNIHWLLTGRGDALFAGGKEESEANPVFHIINGMTPEDIDRVIDLLSAYKMVMAK